MIVLKMLMKNSNWNSNEAPLVFHNGSNYDYHFIIKESANEFEEQFECLRQNKEKYKTFSVPVKKEITKIDKDGNESVETISCKIKLIANMLIISRREFIKLNVKIVVVFLNIKVSRKIR